MAFTPTGVEFIAKGLNKYLSDLGKADKAQQGLSKTATSVGKGFAGLGKSMLSVGALAGGAALAGVGALAAGTVGLGVAATSTAISFESAFTGVTKTIDGLSDPMGNLTQLGKDIRGEFEQLSTVVPATFEEISAIGEIGGQLGIGASSITDFTETVVQLRDTTTLTADEAATDLARLGNIYQISADQMGQNTIQLGSALVALGNNFATNESQILNFASRIAGAGQVVGLAQTDILGIGAAFSSVGVEAEAGGTAVQKVLLGINNAVNAGSSGFVDYTDQIDKNVAKMRDLQATSARLEAQAPGLQEQILAQYDAFLAAGGSADEFGRQLGDKTVKAAFDTALAIRDLGTETQLLRDQQGQPIDSGQLAAFARVAGVTSDEFKAAWQQDAAGAFEMFVEGLGREGDNAANVLDELGLADQRLVRGFLSLAGAGDLLERTMKTANDAFEEGTALQEEAQKRYATTASKIQILKNTFRVFLAQVGDKFLPLFNRVIEIGTQFVKDWAEPIQNAIENVVIPAIDNIIGKAQELITEFQAGGLFGSRSGSFGSAGLLAALGIPPDAVSVIENIFNTINEVIAGFQSGGVGGAFGALFSSESATAAISTVMETISTFLSEQWNSVVLPTLSTWKDSFFNWVTELYPQIPEILSTLVTNITSFLSEQFPVIQETLQQWAMQFWDWVETAASGAGTALAGILIAIGAWATGDGSAQLIELGNQLGQSLVTGIQNLVENQEQMAQIILKVVTGLAIGAAAVAGLLIVIGGQIVAGILQGILDSLGVDLEPATFSELASILSGIGSNIMTIASVIGENIITGIQNGLTTLSEIPGQIITSIQTTFSGLVGNLMIIGQTIIDKIIEGINNAIASVVNPITTFINNMLEAMGITDEIRVRWQAIFDDLLLIASTVLANVVTTITTKFAEIKAQIETQIEAARAAFEAKLTEFLTPIATVFAQMVTDIATKFTEINTQVTTSTTEAATTISTKFNEILTSVTNIFSQIVTTITEKLAEIATAIVTKTAEFVIPFTDTIGEIRNALVDFATEAIQLGVDIVQGLISGVQSTVGSAVESFTSLVESILSSVKSSLGISSPSTLFFGFGTDIVQGLIDGVLSLAGSIGETLTGLFGDLFGGGDQQQAASPFAAFDPATMTEGLNQINALMTQVNAQFMLMSDTLIPALLAMAAASLPQISALWTTLNTLVTNHNALILMLSTVLLPQLLAQSQVTTQTMIAGFTAVNALVQQLIGLITQLMALFTRLGAIAEAAANKIVKGFEKIISATDELLPKLQSIAEGFQAIEAAATAAVNAANSLSSAASGAGIGASSGIGFVKGIGLQSGTLGLGMRVPGTSRGDTFGPLFLEPGEEILVTPRGQSIEGLVFDRLAQAIGGMRGGNQTEINMPIYTAASPQSIVQQLQVIKSLID